jgi:protein TonB
MRLAAAAPRGAIWREAGGRQASSRRLAGSVVVSLFAHAAVILVLVLHHGSRAPAAPPVYRVDLVAAPPGPRAIGTVQPQPATPTPAPAPEPKAAAAPPPPRAAAPPTPKALPTKAKPAKVPVKATPMPPTAAKTKTPAPKTAAGPRAGGGPEGGQGADVANVHVAGLDFPYPGYLQNIVRQVALQFTPPRGSALTADVAFLIHRDGSVSDVRFVKRSGNYAFDLEAQGAIEAVGSKRAFGPLPDAFRGDVLPVTFSFDPRVIR